MTDSKVAAVTGTSSGIDLCIATGTASFAAVSVVGPAPVATNITDNMDGGVADREHQPEDRQQRVGQ